MGQRRDLLIPPYKFSLIEAKQLAIEALVKSSWSPHRDAAVELLRLELQSLVKQQQKVPYK